MVEVYELGGGRKTVLATRETFAEAKAFVNELGVSHMEDDADFTDCADAFLTDGRVVHIQPVNFKLS